MTGLRLLEGHKRDGSTVQVTIGRSVTGRTMLAIGDTSVELDTSETFGLIIGAGDVLRANGFKRRDRQ